MQEPAPIALFVYNRPSHTLRTLQALAKNEFASESLLYVFADGPKENVTTDDLSKIKEVEDIVQNASFCKTLIFKKNEKNAGLANNIVAGVTEVLKMHGKVIVLEDDIVTSRGFLSYMNRALEIYQNNNTVMHISGYMFPVKGKLPETFFYRQASCWGWATWSRAWKYFELDPQKIKQELVSSGKIKDADIDGTGQFLEQLEWNITGKIKTWAVKWHFSVILHDGLCLHPGKSLVTNIGLDGTGEHSGINTLFSVTPHDDVHPRPIDIKDYKKVYPLLKEFYRPYSTNTSLKKRMLRYVPNSIRQWLIRLVHKMRSLN